MVRLGTALEKITDWRWKELPRARNDALVLGARAPIVPRDGRKAALAASFPMR